MHKLLFTQLFLFVRISFIIFSSLKFKSDHATLFEITLTQSMLTLLTHVFFFSKANFSCLYKLAFTHTLPNLPQHPYLHKFEHKNLHTYTHPFFQVPFLFFPVFSFKKRRKMCFQCCDPLCLVLHSHTFLHNEFSTR